MRSRTGYIELIVCGLLWGSIGVLVKEIDVSAPVTVFFRLSLGAASVVAVWALRGRLRELRIPRDRGLVLFAGLTLAFHWVVFFEADSGINCISETGDGSDTGGPGRCRLMDAIFVDDQTGEIVSGFSLTT